MKAHQEHELIDRGNGTPLLVLLAMVTACTAGEDANCTVIGAPAGMLLQVQHPAITTSTLQACWDDNCRTSIVLGATHQGGGKALAPIEGLPPRPVTVTVIAADAMGTTVANGTVTVTPVPPSKRSAMPADGEPSDNRRSAGRDRAGRVTNTRRRPQPQRLSSTTFVPSQRATPFVETAFPPALKRIL